MADLDQEERKKQKKERKKNEEEEAISILGCGEDVIFLQLLSKVEREWPCTKTKPSSPPGYSSVACHGPSL